MRPHRLFGRAVLLGGVLVLALAGFANAATLKVTTTKDSNDTACTAKKCSLRDALTFAAAGDTVSLPASKTPYMVTLGEIKIAQAPLTIKGAGATKSVIKANGTSRVFEITATPASSATITFSGIRITGGQDTNLPGGGAILVDFFSSPIDNLALVKSVVTGNSVTLSTASPRCCFGGGGIYSNGGNVTLTHSVVSGNTATVTASGGIVLNFDGGGGIYDNEGSIKVAASKLAHNSATVTGDYGFQGGGAIYENGARPGSVTISRSKLLSNSFTLNGTQTDITGGFNNCCSGGGAVYQDAGNTTVSRSTLTGNTATINSGNCCHGGGALYMDAGSRRTLAVTRSILSHNTATVKGPLSTSSSGSHCCSGGGAISSFNDMSVTDSTLATNTSNVRSGDPWEGGGAIQLDNTLIKVVGSTISANRSLVSAVAAFSGGGGVYEDTAGSTPSSSYTNSTFSGNTTNAGKSQSGGGGLYVLKDPSGQPDVLANATIAGNSAPSGAGGGIVSGGATIQSKNSLVALNTAAHKANCAAFTYSSSAAVFTSLGFNLTNSPDTCDFTMTGDKVVSASAVKLGPLANNGGPTMTRALLKGSPAIDAGNPAGCTSPLGAQLTTDQRGKPRPDHSETRCDIGAYEFQDKSAK